MKKGILLILSGVGIVFCMIGLIINWGFAIGLFAFILLMFVASALVMLGMESIKEVSK